MSISFHPTWGRHNTGRDRCLFLAFQLTDNISSDLLFIPYMELPAGGTALETASMAETNVLSVPKKLLGEPFGAIVRITVTY